MGETVMPDKDNADEMLLAEAIEKAMTGQSVVGHQGPTTMNAAIEMLGTKGFSGMRPVFKAWVLGEGNYVAHLEGAQFPEQTVHAEATGSHATSAEVVSQVNAEVGPQRKEFALKLAEAISNAAHK